MTPSARWVPRLDQRRDSRLVCALCRDLLATAPQARCSTCDVRWHEECAQALATDRCPTWGCQRPARAPAQRRPGRPGQVLAVAAAAPLLVLPALLGTSLVLAALSDAPGPADLLRAACVTAALLLGGAGLWADLRRAQGEGPPP